MRCLVILCLISTVVAVRNDYVTNIVADNGGPWGNWGNFQYCATGSFVSGFKLKFEGSQGRGDDTALNGVQLYCRYASSKSGAGSVTSTVQKWGSWLNKHRCWNTFAVGMRLQVEGPQGDGDDTAANNLQLKCQDGEHIWGSAGPWGSWGGWSNCPQGSAICGLQTRVEPEDGDDTALNSVRMACCRL